MITITTAWVVRGCIAMAVSFLLGGGVATAADSTPDNAAKSKVSKVGDVNAGSEGAGLTRGIQPRQGKAPPSLKTDTEVVDYRRQGKAPQPIKIEIYGPGPSAKSTTTAGASTAKPGTNKGVKWEGPDFAKQKTGMMELDFPKESRKP